MSRPSGVRVGSRGSGSRPRTRRPARQGPAGTSAKVLGLCGVTVCSRNLPPAPNKTRGGGAGGRVRRPRAAGGGSPGRRPGREPEPQPERDARAGGGSSGGR